MNGEEVGKAGGSRTKLIAVIIIMIFILAGIFYVFNTKGVNSTLITPAVLFDVSYNDNSTTVTVIGIYDVDISYPNIDWMNLTNLGYILSAGPPGSHTEKLYNDKSNLSNIVSGELLSQAQSNISFIYSNNTSLSVDDKIIFGQDYTEIIKATWYSNNSKPIWLTLLFTKGTEYNMNNEIVMISSIKLDEENKSEGNS